MITVRKSEDRGKGKIDWLDSRFSFSFGDYYDPAFESFGPLRVINEDWIKGGAGFPPHPHRDMEIVTYILDGAIAHKDSTGGGGTIRPGEIQRMSAGSGIVHAEFNASATETCHLLQIWIMPSKRGIRPAMSRRPSMRRRCTTISAASPRPSRARMKCGWCRMPKSGPPSWTPMSRRSIPWRRAARPGCRWPRGEVALDGQVLKAGDAAAITDQAQIAVRSKVASEVLLFDLS